MSAIQQFPTGRIPDNPSGCVHESVMIWPAHDEVIARYADHFDVSRAEALRIILEMAAKVSPRAMPAHEASLRISKVREKIRGKAIQERMALEDERRRRRAETARMRRAAKREGT